MGLFDDFVAVRCWKCDVVYGMNSRIHSQRKIDKEEFFCTNGHSAAYVESENDKLRRERDRLAQRLAEKDDRIAVLHADVASAERRGSAARGQVTKIKNRIGNGVCPCCNRTFENLHRHMTTQHPTFAEAAE